MRSFFLLLVAAFAVGCGGAGGVSGGGDLPGGDPGGSSVSSAHLQIWVTDAPFPYDLVDSASVVIREVSVRDRDRDRWETVFSGESEIDLVPLTNGVATLLVDATIPPGIYDEARLIVEAGEVVLGPDAVVEGGNHVFSTANGKLHFPSGSQTGIKVKIANDIVVSTALTADLVLDFDLARNFVFNGPATHAPGVKRVLFTPVVRAINDSTAGSIALVVRSDNVTPGDAGDDFPLEGATVRVLDDADMVVATQGTDADGRVVLSVPPGTYDVEVEAAGHATATLPAVQVVLANLSDLGAVVLAAAGEIGGAVMSDGGTPADTTDDVVVPGATVELRHADALGPVLATTSADGSGMWRFESLEAGAYDVTAAAEGHVPATVEDVAAALETPGHTILLHALSQELSGTVTVPEGVDVTAISIRATNRAGVLVATTSPLADGTYSMTLATGVYDVEFDDGDDAVENQEFQVTIVGAEPAPPAQDLDVTIG